MFALRTLSVLELSRYAVAGWPGRDRCHDPGL